MRLKMVKTPTKPMPTTSADLNAFEGLILKQRARIKITIGSITIAPNPRKY
jgi:hypothetical protein